MASPTTRNVLVVSLIAFVICGVFITHSSRSSPKIDTETVLYSEQYDLEGAITTSPKLQVVTSEIKSKESKLNQKKRNQKMTEKKEKAITKNNAVTHQATNQESAATSSTSSSSSSTSTSTSGPTLNSTLPAAGAAPAAANTVSVAPAKNFLEVDSSSSHPPLNLTDFKMDFEKSTDIDEVMTARIAHIQSTCLQYSVDIQNSIVSTTTAYNKHLLKNKNILTDHKKQISFCTVPKSGSTYWKSVFIFLQKGITLNGMAVGHFLDRHSYRSLNAWDKSKSKGEDYTSFVAVRNPWKRLVSLYQQKIESYLPKLRGKNLASTKGMAPYKYMLKVCHRQPLQLQTFADMLDCVLERDEAHKPNRHWQSAYEYCDICSQHFSYVIRTENMIKEGAYVMEKAGINTADEILNAVRDGTIRDVEKHKTKTYSEYYRDIDQQVIDSLRDIYKWEIELFGYPTTPFTA